MDNNTIVIGAYGSDNEKDSGCANAYVYVTGGNMWTPEGTLQASDQKMIILVLLSTWTTTPT